MITLAMDTAYKHLILGLYRDGKLLAGTAEECFKHQSESVFPELEKLLAKTGLDYQDIDEIVITDGPGSYTGIRIGMTIAKVLASQFDRKLSVVSTMQLYAGNTGAYNVILDARGKRVYAAHVENGKICGEEEILPLAELPSWLQAHPGTLIGDGYLIGEETPVPDFLKNFMDLRENWRPVDNVHALTPRYLKESDAYRT